VWGSRYEAPDYYPACRGNLGKAADGHASSMPSSLVFKMAVLSGSGSHFVDSEVVNDLYERTVTVPVVASPSPCAKVSVTVLRPFGSKRTQDGCTFCGAKVLATFSRKMAVPCMHTARKTTAVGDPPVTCGYLRV